MKRNSKFHVLLLTKWRTESFSTPAGNFSNCRNFITFLIYGLNSSVHSNQLISAFRAELFLGRHVRRCSRRHGHPHSTLGAPCAGPSPQRVKSKQLIRGRPVMWGSRVGQSRDIKYLRPIFGINLDWTHVESFGEVFYWFGITPMES